MRCVLTFIDVGREASDKDLPGVALHPLSILAASGRVQAGSQGRVSVAVVEEAILERKKTGATWEERVRVEEGRERRREKGGEGGKRLRKEPESCDPHSWPKHLLTLLKDDKRKNVGLLKTARKP